MKLRLIILLILITLIPYSGAQATGNADVWPIFYTVQNGGVDNGLLALYDQNASAWQNRTIDTDLLQDQWTPQRNAVGWDTAGKWNVTFIQATGNDLELWESADTQWQDDAGAWAMTDSDNSQNWIAVDVESRQSFIWAIVAITGIDAYSYFIDLSAGGPAWTNRPAMAAYVNFDNTNFSFVLDNNLFGVLHQTIVSAAVKYTFYPWAGSGDVLTAVGTGNFPQIINDKEDRFWIPHTTGNILFIDSSFNQPRDPVFFSGTPPVVYTATALAESHHSSWRAIDDSIHVVLVDFDVGGNTTLEYLRRTPNGWTTSQTLLTVDSLPGGDSDSIIFPQICNATDGSLFVSFINVPNWVTGAYGDLQGYYLASDDYDNYTTIGAGGWVLHANIDGGANDVTQAVMPDYIPISGRM